MGSYRGGYSIEGDAAHALLDFAVERQHQTTANIGGFDESQYFVYLLANTSSGEEARRHRVVPIYVLERNVQLNARFKDGSDNQLVALGAAFNLEATRLAFTMAIDALLAAIRPPEKPQFSTILRQVKDQRGVYGSLLDRVFTPIGREQTTTINDACSALFKLMEEHMADLDSGATQAPLHRLLSLLDWHKTGHIQFVLLPEVVGHAGDLEFSSRALVRHAVDTKQRHHIFLTKTWFKSKRPFLRRFVWQPFAGFFGYRTSRIVLESNLSAESIHIRLQTPPGMVLRYVQPTAARHRIVRWVHHVAPWTRSLLHRFRVHLAAPTERQKLAARHYSRVAVEELFCQPVEKYARRTRNTKTFYIHFPRQSVDQLSEYHVSRKTLVQKGYLDRADPIELAVKMRESLTAVLLSMAPVAIGLLSTLATIALGRQGVEFRPPSEVIAGVAASAYISYIVLIADKPALQRYAVIRLLVGAVAILLALDVLGPAVSAILAMIKP